MGRGLRLMLSWVVGIVLVAAIVVVVGLGHLAHQSRQGHPPAHHDGQLAPCPSSPNCWVSEYPLAADHHVAPLQVGAGDWRPRAEFVLVAMGGKVVEASAHHLSAEFRSAKLGFVDDLQLRLDPQRQLLHLRAASRVGYSDLGANRRRVAELRRRWRAALNSP